MFKSQTIVIWSDKDDKGNGFINSGTIVKATKSEVYLRGEEFPRYAAFLYPDTPECVQFLETGIAISARHKKENVEYMSATYEFNNDLIRKGLK